MKNLALFPWPFALILVASIPASIAQSPAGQTLPATYGDLPLLFESNQGQADPSFHFVAHGIGYTLLLGRSEATLVLHRPQKLDTDKLKRKQPLVAPSAPDRNNSIVTLQMVGANTHSQVTAENKQMTRTNYFLGNNPANWHTDIPNYQRVRYHSLYDGIDLLYYGNHGQLEHDFVVTPGADPAKITLAFNLAEPGHEKLRLDPATGDLLIADHSQLRLLKPVTYQESDGKRSVIPSRYKLLAGNRISFSIGRFDHGKPLIIDPILSYSTYLGGTGGDQGNGIAVDSSGNTYIVGTTNSTDFPVTAGAFQSQNNSTPAGHGSTVFVSKLNAIGTGLIYSTYLGGSGGEVGYAIALDGSDNAYVTGSTWSTDFPVTCGAFDIQNKNLTPGSPTAFVAKLAPSGDRLAYATYLGGQGNLNTPPRGDVAQAIAVTGGGNAIVSGYTSSINFPITKGAFQTTFRGVSLTSGSTLSSNAFVTELNGMGTALVYSTYLGGSGYPAGDVANSIAVDHLGNAFITGTTGSSDFPTTPGTLQPALIDSTTTSAFVTELNPLGQKLVYSTYLGGTGTTSAMAIALDSSGLAYVAGMTNASDFPLTAGVVEGANLKYLANFVSYGPVGFLTKLKQDASQAVYSTFVEGHDTSITGLAIDTTGNAYVSGSTTTTGAGRFAAFQPTPDALPLPASTGTSAFVVKLNPLASELNYASLLGGSSNDSATALALDNAGNAYITGTALSTNFPITNGAFQSTNQAAAAKASNGFVSKFALLGENNHTTYTVGIPAQGIPTTLTLNWAEWVPGNDWALSVSVNLNSGSQGPPPTGQVTVTANGVLGCCDVPAQLPGLSWTGVTPNLQTINYLNGNGAPGDPFLVTYSGDAIYQSSSVTGPYCIIGQTCPLNAPATQPLPPVKINAIHAGTSGSRVLSAKLPSTKFVLPQPTPTGLPRNAGTATPACIVGANLTVTVKNSFRVYGSANPTFIYTITGLLNGDTVTVTPTTTATIQSPVGDYPVTAVVSGAAAANYTITIDPGTLSIHKAVLSISAANVAVTYGHAPPPPTAYKLAGFVNGDTASVVSGAPILTTTVTAKTPVGFYAIGVQVGSLTAANYAFSTVSNGMGSVGVYRAPLAIQAQSVSSTYGHTPPPLTAFKLLGFVNGDTSSVISGAPLLTTTVTSTTHVGSYPIHVQVGTLTATNYFFNTSAMPQGAVLVAKAPITVHAHTVNTVYGQTPPQPTAYDLIGFLNGDTASVVSGAPVLSTTVTATTPVGFYKIDVQIGTLTAANYAFTTISNGYGVVGVYRALLKVTADNLTMTQGGSVPPLTYTITGFVNGDTAATAVTGAPVLTTIATSASKAGKYPISIAPGTLVAHNYYFAPVPGVLTVSP